MSLARGPCAQEKTTTNTNNDTDNDNDNSNDNANNDDANNDHDNNAHDNKHTVNDYTALGGLGNFASQEFYISRRSFRRGFVEVCRDGHFPGKT